MTPYVPMIYQLQVLSKGLHFVPYSRFNLFQNLIDLNRFVRRHFHSLDAEINDNVSTSREIVNEFSSLLFNEQMALCDIKDLEREQRGG